MSSEKRKKVVVSIETKLEALKRLDRGETMQQIASDLGVGRVTVGDWKRKRSELEKWSCDRNSEDALKGRKSMKRCEYEQTSEALFLWYSQQRARGMPISGPILQEKALTFQKEFEDGEQDFTASVGWLDRWKKRYGIRQLNVCGESLSADPQAVFDFRNKLHTLIDKEGITGEQLYNCDETGLNFKMLPTKTLASMAEKSAPGFKRSKERVTVLACSNATGNHKLKLVLIGKSKRPRAFKHMSIAALPVTYKSQKNAWMDSEIFRDWFLNEFVPSVERFLTSLGLPRKAVLIIDNAPTHPNVEELRSGDIKTVFLPPNVTSLCQPMDQGVLETLKKKYRRKLLSKLIHAMDERSNTVEMLKQVNMKDVIFWISECWDEIETHTLARSWKILLSEDESAQDLIHENNGNLIQLLQKIPGCEEAEDSDIQEWMNSDEQHELTDGDIIAMVNGAEVEDHGESDAESELQKEETINHSEGVKILEAALTYIEQQPEATATDVMLLRRWRDLAARKRATASKQTSIKDFFTK